MLVASCFLTSLSLIYLLVCHLQVLLGVSPLVHLHRLVEEQQTHCRLRHTNLLVVI